MRNIRLLLPLMVWFFYHNTMAMEASAEGQYVAVDANGQSGHIIFRLQHESDHWLLQAQTAQGQWENVSCVHDCELNEATVADKQTLLGASILEQAEVSCLQNQAVAFCRLSDTQDVKQIYALVIHSGEQPAVVRLKRHIAQ